MKYIMHVNVDVWGGLPLYGLPCILTVPFSFGQLQKLKLYSMVLANQNRKIAKSAPGLI